MWDLVVWTLQSKLPNCRSDMVFFFFKKFLVDTCPFLVVWTLQSKLPNCRSDMVFFFFKKSFWWTHVLFWGHWYPCFGFLVMSPLGFKARVGSALFAIFAEADVMYIPQDSPLVLHLPTFWAAGAQPVTSPHACAEVGLGSDSNVQSHKQKTNALPFCQRPSSHG